jgi:hypothetical protein
LTCRGLVMVMFMKIKYLRFVKFITGWLQFLTEGQTRVEQFLDLRYTKCIYTKEYLKQKVIVIKGWEQKVESPALITCQALPTHVDHLPCYHMGVSLRHVLFRFWSDSNGIVFFELFFLVRTLNTVEPRYLELNNHFTVYSNLLC